MTDKTVLTFSNDLNVSDRFTAIEETDFFVVLPEPVCVEAEAERVYAVALAKQIVVLRVGDDPVPEDIPGDLVALVLRGKTEQECFMKLAQWLEDER